jgi:hypothetical protein
MDQLAKPCLLSYWKNKINIEVNDNLAAMKDAHEQTLQNIFDYS